MGGEPILRRPLKAYKSIGNEETKIVSKVVKSGKLSGFVGAWCDEFEGGPYVRQLEKDWQLIFKCKHAISVNSNTSGLIAALGAIGLSPGEEVIVPPVTMSATAMAPLIYGGVPVFVDIEKDYFCLDVAKVRNAINSKTKAIIAVNLFGHPAYLNELKEIADKNNIFLIEDAAQCPLATENDIYAGTVGHIGVFSLNYHKHIHTGEGGICCTNDDHLAIRLKAIRNHGENVVEPLNIKDSSNLIGFNFRMTELSAAVGIEQLKKLKRLVLNRENIAKRLSGSFNSFEGFEVPLVRNDCRHVYYVWAAKVNLKEFGLTRNIIAKALKKEGVPVEEGYVKPLYLLPAFQRKIAIGKEGWPFSLNDKDYSVGLCPVAESIYEESLLEFCICAYQLNSKDLNAVINGFCKVFENIKTLCDYKNIG